ncbi:hypothetical protein CISG_09446 [Coccidioides immitis RMSCC 3703]|nr:hypothetical protein CIRG_02909 [Coccidioides immitis RMSCC 2394]KMU72493.1 hypothetical protein CISG_09446 [Coccidioides immitis RMSCC 3703]
MGRMGRRIILPPRLRSFHFLPVNIAPSKHQAFISQQQHVFLAPISNQGTKQSTAPRDNMSDMMVPPTFCQRVNDLAEPAPLLLGSAWNFTVVFLDTVFRRGELLAPVLRMSQIRAEGFSRFWIKFSGARDPASSIPAERVGSSALMPALLSTASGVILDIGPGTGTQMPLLTSPDIKAIYGAEPTDGLHTDLLAKIDSCGLSSKYQILHCGAEPQSLIPALDKAGFKELGSGVFDTIICVRVLCSVPRPEETIQGLYRLLKPGGKLLIAEHVVNPWCTRQGSIVGRLAQLFYTLLGWPFFMGSCDMNRDTGKMLRKAAERDGGWASDTLKTSFAWGPMPYVSGILVKRS